MQHFPNIPPGVFPPMPQILPPIRCIFPPPPPAVVNIPQMEEAGPPYYRWCRMDLFSDHLVIVKVGSTKDGKDVFIGRARHGLNQLPAVVTLHDHPLAFLAWRGSIYKKFFWEFQMLLVLRGSVEWERARDGKVPPFALPAGRMADGELVYIGRVAHDGAVTPGRVVESEGACFIPYDFRELAFREYEVLTLV